MFRSSIPKEYTAYVAVGLLVGLFIISMYDKLTPVPNYGLLTEEQQHRTALLLECQKLLTMTRESMRIKREESKPVPDQRTPSYIKNRSRLFGEGMLKLNDTETHRDDAAVAESLFHKVRVLCWIMTSPATLQERAYHVKQTWGKRCNVLLFMSTKAEKTLPAIALNITEGYDHLTAKSMAAFKYVYDHHFNDADWFMKADDDTYVIVENLRYFLSDKNPDEAVFYGHHFTPFVKQGYFSGGAGYVLSKMALTKWHAGRMNCSQDFGAEDVEMGKCMELNGVKTGKTTDANGRSRFHCFNVHRHISGKFPRWYYHYDANGAKTNAMSDYAISFHYVPPEQLYWMEYFVYHLRPYGIVSHLQTLNNI